MPVHDILKNVIFSSITFPLSQWFHQSHKTKKHSKEHKKRTFKENASAALLTFLVSGLFHEVMSVSSLLPSSDAFGADLSSILLLVTSDGPT